MNQIESLAEEIKKLLEKEDRKDVEFRMNLLLSEVGDLAKYITHDQNLNPNARPHGNKEDEALAYGQAFVQLIAAALLRGIDLNQAVSLALDNWQKSDWRKTANNDQTEISGLQVEAGEINGEVFLDPEANNLQYINDQILVTKVLKPHHVSFFQKIKGIITDHGGLSSHAAILAREYKIPCVVGTGNATEKLKHGQQIKTQSQDGRTKIIIIS